MSDKSRNRIAAFSVSHLKNRSDRPSVRFIPGQGRIEATIQSLTGALVVGKAVTS